MAVLANTIETADVAPAISIDLVNNLEKNIGSLMELLGVTNDADVLVCSLITIPPTGIPDMTTNLLAPIVINRANMKAKQVVLEKTSYTTKHRLFPEKKGE